MTLVKGFGQVEVVTFGEVKRSPVQDRSNQGWSLALEDLQRTLPFLAAIGMPQIEVEPVSDDLGPEVRWAAEGFPIEALIFDASGHRFDIALPRVALGRNVTVLAPQGALGGGQPLRWLIFQELTAVVGLPDHPGEVHAVTGQGHRQLFGQEGGIAFGPFIGITGKAGAGDGLADGVLEAGQVEVGHLRPVMRDILEILGVGGELAKEFPVAFDRAELLFGGGFLFPRPCPLMRSKDPGKGVVAARQVKFPLEALGAEAGWAAQFDDLAFQTLGDLVGRVLGATAAFDPSGGFTGLITAPPFADGVAGAAELAGGSLDAVGAGPGNQFLMPPMTVGAPTIEFKVGAVPPRRVADFSRRGCASSGGGAAVPFCVGGSTP